MTDFSSGEAVHNTRKMFVNPALCVACGYCEGACPVGAIRVTDMAEINHEICLRCQSCAGRCPMGAIRLSK